MVLINFEGGFASREVRCVVVRGMTISNDFKTMKSI